MSHSFIHLYDYCLSFLVLATSWYMGIPVVWNSPVSLRKVKMNYTLCKSMPRMKSLVWNLLKSIYFSICETVLSKPNAAILLQSTPFQMEEFILKWDVSLSTVILKDSSAEYDLLKFAIGKKRGKEFSQWRPKTNGLFSSLIHVSLPLWYIFNFSIK